MAAIGSFEIGVSAIGGIPFNWQQTLISQYANDPVMLALLLSVSENIDPAQSIDDFYDYVWNVNSAQGFGLDIWGDIVGISRYLNTTSKFLGFEEAGTLSADPFNQSPFYSGNMGKGIVALSDPNFKTLVLAKGAANVCNGSIISINALMNYIWAGRGGAWCTDGENMTMTYTFNFTLTPVDISIIETGVLPKPCGVSYSIVQI